MRGRRRALLGPEQHPLPVGILIVEHQPGEVTIFKSLGLAVEDVAAAHLAYTRAVARGLGTEVKV